MAQKVVRQLVDDLDGSEAGETVEFGLDGVRFTIDLCETNAEALRGVFGEYIPHARRTGGRVKRGTTAGGGGKGDDGKDVREWAVREGMPVAERGRIPGHVLKAYRNAAKEGGRTTKGTRTTRTTKRRPRRT